MKKSTKLLVTAISILVISGSGSAGNVVGNGGDHVRSTFLAVGNAVLNYLQNAKEGRQLLVAQGLTAEQLAQSLTIDSVGVVETTLVDNGGSVVDAIGVPGKITLNKFSWFEHFEKQRDIYSLVFHEMLRSNGINDDNYVISKSLYPFPRNFMITTRVAEYIPLIGEDLLDGILDGSKIAFAGTGCTSSDGSLAEFDREHNTLDLSFTRYAADASQKAFDRQACGLAIPVKLPAGKRLVISLLDLEAVVQMSPGSNATIHTEAFLAGSKAPAKDRLIVAGNDGKNGRALVRRTDLLKSSCGKADTLRLNTSVVINKANSSGAKIAVRGAKLFFAVEDCK